MGGFLENQIKSNLKTGWGEGSLNSQQRRKPMQTNTAPDNSI
jgi:hypothetical protein